MRVPVTCFQGRPPAAAAQAVRISRRTLAGLLGARCFAGAGRPLVFAAVADIQFADKDAAGARRYRESEAKLRAAADALAHEKAAFTVQLGDLVDEGETNFDRISALLARLPAPRRHVLGNHDFFSGRETVLRRFGLRRAYYDFTVGGWRFVVLDGMNVAVKGGWARGSANFTGGARILEELKAKHAPNANDWNGAAGPEQREWLAGVLAAAARRRQPCIVFCHFPVVPESCRPEHLLWDWREVLEILDKGRPAAWINGHDHRGGYAERGGVHYITLPGIVEHEGISALRVVELHGDRMVVRPAGAPGGQVYRLR